MAFQVKSILDGNTFTVSPRWEWRHIKGDIVTANGFPNLIGDKVGFLNSKKKLSKLILGKNVQLKKVNQCKYGCIFCDVYIDGKNISTFFTKPKTATP